MSLLALVRLVRLEGLMALTAGRPEVVIGLIDGPVAGDHPALAARFRTLSGDERCTGPACGHGTFVAGILASRRGGAEPALCPDCTFLSRPIFLDSCPGAPGATAAELAAAMRDCIAAGARILNLSLGVQRASAAEERELAQALALAVRRGVLVVAAAGNEGRVGSSLVTRHPWVIPVVASDLRGRPLGFSNLGAAIGRHGLCAPGEAIPSLAPGGATLISGGTSAAAPFVTGTLALLASLAPRASAAVLRRAIAPGVRRASLLPPMLDAQSAHQQLVRSLD